jgi:protein transport protein SEC61 subunit gamma-like protein
MKLQKLKSFYNECVRVFRITKKPTKDEYKAIMKVAGLGILLIGFIGFLIHLIEHFI